MRAFAALLLTGQFLFSAQLFAQVPAQPDWQTAGDAWWSHVQYLADDKLEGRLPGTPGFEAATQYVVSQFKLAGLKPAGTNGYLQPIKLTALRLDRDKSTVELTSDGDGKHSTLKLGEDITLSPHVTAGPPY